MRVIWLEVKYTIIAGAFIQYLRREGNAFNIFQKMLWINVAAIGIDAVELDRNDLDYFPPWGLNPIFKAQITGGDHGV